MPRRNSAPRMPRSRPPEALRLRNSRSDSRSYCATIVTQAGRALALDHLAEVSRRLVPEGMDGAPLLVWREVRRAGGPGWLSASAAVIRSPPMYTSPFGLPITNGRSSRPNKSQYASVRSCARGMRMPPASAWSPGAKVGEACRSDRRRGAALPGSAARGPGGAARRRRRGPTDRRRSRSPAWPAAAAARGPRPPRPRIPSGTGSSTGGGCRSDMAAFAASSDVPGRSAVRSDACPSWPSRRFRRFERDAFMGPRSAMASAMVAAPHARNDEA